MADLKIEEKFTTRSTIKVKWSKEYDANTNLLLSKFDGTSELTFSEREISSQMASKIKQWLEKRQPQQTNGCSRSATTMKYDRWLTVHSA